MVLPSGAELVAQPAPFADSRALYQALLEEMKGLKIEGATKLDYNLMKDAICVLLGSKKIEAAITKCMERATYNGVRIDKDTFEAVEAREDYFAVILEIVRVNVEPFMKNLSAVLNPLIGMFGVNLA